MKDDLHNSQANISNFRGRASVMDNLNIFYNAYPSSRELFGSTSLQYVNQNVFVLDKLEQCIVRLRVQNTLSGRCTWFMTR